MNNATLAEVLISALESIGATAAYSWDSAATAVRIPVQTGTLGIMGTSDEGDADVDYPATDERHRGLLVWHEGAEGEEQYVVYDSDRHATSLQRDVQFMLNAIRPYLTT
ncbi:hypothetical protein [Streptomyces lavendulae]|uniref:hypothetical protein n=1 Tax=Streptomyces lavendulae TaxID=1914 RepID=UPI003694016A